MQKLFLTLCIVSFSVPALAQNTVIKGKKGTLKIDGDGNISITKRKGAKRARPGKGLGLAALGKAVGDGIHVSGNKKAFSAKCKPGQNAFIAGNKNNVKLTGPCGRIDVSGNQNFVFVRKARAIAVSGNKNRVEYLSGVDTKKPRIGVSGNKNSVAKRKQAK